MAIPVAKGQEDLLNFINEVIAEMKANGEMERIYQEPAPWPSTRSATNKKSPVSLSLAQQTTRIGGKR